MFMVSFWPFGFFGVFGVEGGGFMLCVISSYLRLYKHEIDE